MSDTAVPLRLVTDAAAAPACDGAIVESYRRLADVFPDFLVEPRLDAPLPRNADAKSRARFEHQAQTDPLPGPYTPRFFPERLRAALTKASRSHDAVSVLML